jgi:hypothetical protein
MCFVFDKFLMGEPNSIITNRQTSYDSVTSVLLMGEPNYIITNGQTSYDSVTSV